MENQRKRARDAGKFSVNINEGDWVQFEENIKKRSRKFLALEISIFDS